MRLYKFFISAVLILAVSCSEHIDIETRTMNKSFLAVEAVITDIPMIQAVYLSRTCNYFSEDEPAPVSDALVEISSDLGTVVFHESKDTPGVYQGPFDFCAVPGHTYHLRIEAPCDDGQTQVYTAVSEMPEPGFRIDSIDYKYMGESVIDEIMSDTWTVYVWGQDSPKTNRYFIVNGVNWNFYPVDLGLLMPDLYFNGQVINAFPIGILNQTEENVKIYGDCCKPLEEGDDLEFAVLTLPDELYEFLLAFTSNVSMISIPLMTPPPANMPSNIVGKDAVGVFAACPVAYSTREVDDPYRTHLLSEPPALASTEE